MEEQFKFKSTTPIRKISMPGYQPNKPDTYQVNDHDCYLIKFDDEFFETSGKVKINIYAFDGVESLYLRKEIIDSPVQVEYDLPDHVLEYSKSKRKQPDTK